MLLLAQQLPPEARIWQSDGWGVDRELSAQTVELLSTILDAYGQVHTDPKKKWRGTPVKIPRPWDELDPPSSARQALVDLARRLAGTQPGGG